MQDNGLCVGAWLSPVLLSLQDRAPVTGNDLRISKMQPSGLQAAGAGKENENKEGLFPNTLLFLLQVKYGWTCG